MAPELFMSRKLSIIFADFLRSLRQLWLEVLGGIFLAFGLLFIVTAVQEYRKYVSTPGYGTRSLILAIFFSGLMLLFALESFWKARKPRP
jgi:formate/nitrite transporter FocA (FNT family)